MARRYIGILETADFCGLSACELICEPVGPPKPIEQDLTEFFGILALDSIPTEDSLVRKISIRRAWVCATASLIEPAKMRECRELGAKENCSDPGRVITRRL